jgi:hypothetical protein
MAASPDPISREQDETLVHTAVPLDSLAALAHDAPRDLYAESELQLRHERTERSIRRAQEQS